MKKFLTILMVGFLGIGFTTLSFGDNASAATKGPDREQQPHDGGTFGGKYTETIYISNSKLKSYSGLLRRSEHS